MAMVTVDTTAAYLGESVAQANYSLLQYIHVTTINIVVSLQ